ncbi:MAG: beta-hydroxyacyl-ACP dehydratase [Bacteroidales bacterium]|nr:beta-hydroxyacyl-ACP dehydratase [Bacteroidales bacterium]
MKTQDYQYIIDRMPYGKDFLFIDKIISVDGTHIKSEYHLPEHSVLYQGHFKDITVVPGVILLEIMGQTGLVAQSIYLNKDEPNKTVLPLVSLINAEFHSICFPNTKLIINSEVIYFRHKVLKAKMGLYKSDDMSLIASSTSSINVRN